MGNNLPTALNRASGPRVKHLRGLLLATLAAVGSAAFSADQIQPEPQPSRTLEERQPRALVVVADQRFGDVLWENDRTAHRIYGHLLEAAEPPSGSGIDAWGKSVRWPFMQRQLVVNNYHAASDEGWDFYHVGQTRGSGGLGVWKDNKLWTSRNYRTVRILQNGPAVAQFEVTYAPWPVDVDRRVWETRRFTLPMGTNFTQMVSTLSSDSAEPLIVGIGIAKAATPKASLAPPPPPTLDRARGMMSVWDQGTAETGAMGVAVLVDPAMLVDVKEDADNYLLLIRVEPGKPFVYYSGATWSKGQDFPTREAWDGYVRSQSPDFDPAQ